MYFNLNLIIQIINSRQVSDTLNARHSTGITNSRHWSKGRSNRTIHQSALSSSAGNPFIGISEAKWQDPIARAWTIHCRANSIDLKSLAVAQLLADHMSIDEGKGVATDSSPSSLRVLGKHIALAGTISTNQDNASGSAEAGSKLKLCAGLSRDEVGNERWEVGCSEERRSCNHSIGNSCSSGCSYYNWSSEDHCYGCANGYHSFSHWTARYSLSQLEDLGQGP